MGMKTGMATDHGGFGRKEKLAAKFSQAPRPVRRLRKVAALEDQKR